MEKPRSTAAFDQPSSSAKQAKLSPRPKDGSELAHASREERRKALLAHAGRLLAMKDWCRQGLAQRLFERFNKAPEAHELAQEVAARMQEIGALDDGRFARGFLRSRLGRKSQSTALRELGLQGVSKDDGLAALAALMEEGVAKEPADHAWEIWSKKFHRPPADDKERSKQARHMAARGFSYEAMAKVWARAKANLDDQ